MVVDSDHAKKIAEILLQIKAVSINTQKPFRFVSGILSPVYTDNRLLISHPNEWNTVIDGYIAAIESYKPLPEVLSGTATAAIPHAAVLSHRMQIPMVYVRSSKKDHGKENLIEGEFAPGSRVLIIEDLVSTGKSIAGNVAAIREAGGVVETCLAITTSTRNAFEETLTTHKISLQSLTTIEIVIQTALEKSLISQADKDMIDSFLRSPKSWGHDYGFE